ncbi:glutamate racemase [Galbibacter pacificus]|uniref:Glutamate racemase n=1 Tax=Galbibacter pacificus TaxID=2996052 RepID=A0ABT6FTA7_9FLAO|nr:glutamate racemase [Galbibacter pacificus]MDG3582401.1 glutamate racemase [Galbibacter pacificus]MDG3586481.1 glutamate racemase [Galbibacter pacificus]
MNSQPIGIFDSGVGGTSIWKEIHHLLPGESTIYLADSKYAPYGERPQKEILQLSIKNTEFLLSQNCKAIVVACNTATTNAIDYLRKNYKVPFIGIEPAIKPAALNSKTGVVGILATRGTLTSGLFAKTSALYAKDRKVIEQFGDGLVPLIENGMANSEEMHQLLQKYLRPMMEEKADYLVLGCTHYPYLIPQLKKILPTSVTIIDSGEAVAKQTKTVLENFQLLNTRAVGASYIFHSNADEKVLASLLKDYKQKIVVSHLDF